MLEQNKLSVALKSLNTNLEVDFTNKSISLLNKESNKIRKLLLNINKTMTTEIEKYNNTCIKANTTINPEKIQEIVNSNNEKREQYVVDLNELIQTINIIEKKLKELSDQQEKEKANLEKSKKIEEIKNWIEDNKEVIAKTILKSKESNKGMTNISVLRAIKEFKITDNK